MESKAKIDTMAQKVVELLVNEQPSYHEAQQALEIAGFLLSGTTCPVFRQE